MDTSGAPAPGMSTSLGPHNFVDQAPLAQGPGSDLLHDGSAESRGQKAANLRPGDPQLLLVARSWPGGGTVGVGIGLQCSGTSSCTVGAGAAFISVIRCRKAVEQGGRLQAQSAVQAFSGWSRADRAAPAACADLHRTPCKSDERGGAACRATTEVQPPSGSGMCHAACTAC